MTDPLSLDVQLSEFDASYEAWVLRDANSGMYVTIPHPKYPGRTIRGPSHAARTPKPIMPKQRIVRLP
ncbi:MAG: hypothetical protein M3R51_04435 [Candidatus Eremiobacteraeota bacterium]|nr:hypothetical protein [Candidatus Eremiobacteraeota bacterium]